MPTKNKSTSPSPLVLRLQKDLPQIKWEADKELATYSYFKIGGLADAYAAIRKETHLQAAVHYCYDNAINYAVLGGLSNIIVPDEGYRGVILHNQTKDIEIIGDDEVYFSAGWKMNLLVQKLIDLGLGGIESFASLPGSLGGALYNNSHFQKEYIGCWVKDVKVYDPACDQVCIIDQNQCDFAYDYSCFHNDERLILGATLKLEPTDKKVAQEKARSVAMWRLERQPLNLPSSGCIFRNIKNNDFLKELFPQFAAHDLFPTGFLIDQAGLKGRKIGGVQISEKHAAFIVNIGGGTAEDVVELITLIKTEINNKYQIELHEEVFYLR